MSRLSKIGAACLAAFGWTGISTVTASYLVVAGGGGGGGTGSTYGGGGGAGGYRTSTLVLNPSLSYAVTVGGGGAAGTNGGDSTFSSVTSTGGGRGGEIYSASTGGSGGGGGYYYYPTGAAGNTPSTSPSQGNSGGNGYASAGSPYTGGGGGGAGAAGSTYSGSVGGAGGIGAASSISGTSTYYAGGGGGASGVSTGGAGGTGGGGTGSGNGGAIAPIAGTANTGGGGGGGGYTAAAGGSGIVIISYAGVQQFSGGVVTSVGGNTIHTFTTSGTLGPITPITASYLIVAGGGSGANGNASIRFGGGGGAGGLLSGSGLTLDSNSTYLVTVGAGGASQTTANTQGNTGSSSSFSMVSTTAVGGGLSGIDSPSSDGGSGGGGSYLGGVTQTPGNGTSGQGNNGGTATSSAGGGGGGAGAVGSNASGGTAGAGGAGSSSSISGTATYYAGGGGGGGSTNGAGGTGGGGAGGGTSGTANTGGGGGGTATNVGSGAGGSGVVIISYPGSTQLLAGGTVTIVGGNVIHTFTSTGYLAPIKYATNSLRFRSSASAYLNRTPSVASNRDTWTWSGWVKRGTLSSLQFLFQQGADQNNASSFRFNSGDTLEYNHADSGSNTDQCTTSAVFRDPAAWYHLVLSVDTTQATEANRVKIYVNGNLQVLGTANYPAQNVDTDVNSTSVFRIGSQVAGTPYYFDGYMAEVNFVDGQALTPNSFGTFNSYGVWQPINYGGSYGTNGFYLPFTGGSSYYGAFNGSNQYLQATLPATLTGAFTMEFYLYRSGTGNQFCATLGDSNASTGLEYYIGTSGTVNNVYSSGAQITSTTNLPVANAWNHVAITRDSSNVVRLFVNGTQAGSTWTTASAFSNTLRIGVEYYSGSITGYINGNLSNFRIVNGTALYTNNFAPPTSALTAVSGTSILTLQSSTIIDNSGNSLSITNNNSVTTTQAYPFTMIGNVSKDYSPNGNNWTNNNIGVVAGSTLDVMTDVPTLTSATAANYAVLNPIRAGVLTGSTAAPVVTNGNLTAGLPSSGYGYYLSTIAAPSTGYWYAEFAMTSGTYSGANNQVIGLLDVANTTSLSGQYLGSQSSTYGYLDGDRTTGSFRNAGTTSQSVAGYQVGDTIMIAFGNGKLWWGKNGTWLGTGSPNPATATSPAYSGLTGDYFIVAQNYSSPYGYVIDANFGQRPFAYTPPSGYVALNTYNM